MKKAATLALAAFVALVLGSACLFSCAEKEPETQTINLMIDSSAAVQKGYTGKAILFNKEIKMPAGGTLEDALTEVGIEFEENGGYISSINGLAEGDYGAQSGWTYTVNGEYPTEGNIVLHEGDSVEFIYELSYAL